MIFLCCFQLWLLRRHSFGLEILAKIYIEYCDGRGEGARWWVWKTCKTILAIEEYVVLFKG